ncbi:hypothetical protein [Nocardioides perillae]|uniref:Lipoprotein n=1 Tax=Nocardioides perillae TaxID=1119534 RepID=A0A7Y9UM44_9ACTN|nr:hypothetical protein [Nocardioides perillae]NYG55016.1 hypothetical protein [Nocardioides perillae]
MSRRRGLGAATLTGVLVLGGGLLAGCGADEGGAGGGSDPRSDGATGTATEPAAEPTADAAPSASSGATPREVGGQVHVLGLHRGSAAGGTTGPPVRLTGPDDVAVLGLDGRRAAPLERELRAAWRDWQATEPAPSWALAAAVVSVGCERPVDVDVELEPLTVTAVPRAADKGVQCLVPVTTVALVEVPTDTFT